MQELIQQGLKELQMMKVCRSTGVMIFMKHEISFAESRVSRGLLYYLCKIMFIANAGVLLEANCCQPILPIRSIGS